MDSLLPRFNVFPLASEESNLPSIPLFSIVMVFLITTHCSLITGIKKPSTSHSR